MNIIHGDSLDKLKELEDNSIDSIVTDPPYGLSFMGKKWDYDVPSQEIWEECLRVLKPGGYLLAFAGTRTQHRMAVRIEDAGFEIRDMIAWVYGSGFPKSLNIGKNIDKLQGNEREVVGNNPNLRENNGKNNNYKFFFTKEGTFATTEGMKKISKGTSPYEGYGTALKPALEPITVARKPISEKTVAQNVLKYGTGGINIDECRVGIDENDINQRPNGSGTKSAIWGNTEHKWENTLDMNKGRFPANLIHDGSDEVVGLFPNTKNGGQNYKGGNRKSMFGNKEVINQTIYAGDSGSASRFFYCAKASKAESYRDSVGRFPANLIHDGSDEVVGLFPETNRIDKRTNCKSSTGMFFEKSKVLNRPQDNGGSASRFFYCAKASKSERNRGCEELEEKQYSHDGREKEIENAFQRNKSVATNNHPTVKPISLMRYLVRLVTPKGGTVLDPFMGSGTTGIGAKLEGFDFIGIEREEEYIKIAEARINAWEAEKQKKLI